MPAPTLSIIQVKDGNNVLVNGGVSALDVSGGLGAGPWIFGKVIVDGVTGVNLWNINASGQGRVLAAQDGAWSVQAVQSGAWAVGQSGVWDIRNITGTVSLPTGAATAAKQPQPGTAGSPSADVLSVQGVPQGTPQPVDAAMSSALIDMLNQLLIEHRLTNLLLSEGMNVTLDLAAARSDPTLDPMLQ